jgi:hypothetical protein
MLKWDELFGGTLSTNKVKAEPLRKTNMFVLLMPWIIIWIAIAINPTIGGALGIIAAASVPLIWLVFRPVVFEQISVPIVIGLSMAVLFGANARIILTASYGVFGMMWLVGAFSKIPLTANYSANNYGGDKAFANPLFMRTNRILTAAWGILYLITPIWTYILMGTELSVYTGLINSVCPAVMGAFTVWFQKWYPARWARS